MIPAKAHAKFTFRLVGDQEPDDIIAKSMQAIGDAWQCEDVEVYQERRGCEIVARVWGELARTIPPVHQSAPIAIGCSPGGDTYSLASRLVEMVLRENGWQATSFGSDIPFDSLILLL